MDTLGAWAASQPWRCLLACKLALSNEGACTVDAARYSSGMRRSVARSRCRRLGTELRQVREVLVESLPQARGIVEEDSMLGTDLLDNGVKGMVVAVVDAGEEVVLDLIVEAACEEKGGVAGVAKSVASQDLVLVKVAAVLVNVLVCQVVDLGGEHEGEADHHHWYHCKEDCLPEGEEQEWQHVAHEKHHGATGEMDGNPGGGELNHLDATVVLAGEIHLQRLDEVHGVGADGPDRHPARRDRGKRRGGRVKREV